MEATTSIMVPRTQGPWDARFEEMVRDLDRMPPSLLRGFLGHVVRAMYGRGVVGSSEHEPKRLSHRLINGAASALVRATEVRLREELAMGEHSWTGGTLKGSTGNDGHNLRTLRIPRKVACKADR